MADQLFLAYWLGYIPGNSSLEETPAGVTHVALAFAVTGPTANGDGITVDFLTKDHSEAEIRAGAKALQARGVKVLMSINGNPNWDGHPGGWTNLDAPVFAANVKSVAIDDWGLDGVDLDNEASEVPGEDFVSAVQALRAALGPQPLITLPVYEGAWRDGYLSQVADDISFVSTMAYWNGLQGQIGLFDQYAGLVGSQKVAIGVGNAANPGQNTPFDQVAPIAAWDPPGASKAGAMLWNLNSPTPDVTAIWCETVARNLPATP
ncbi:MAG TPA: glycosyl hydrolase family 18 protein [Allosphingosinicella sp.]